MSRVVSGKCVDVGATGRIRGMYVMYVGVRKT